MKLSVGGDRFSLILRILEAKTEANYELTDGKKGGKNLPDPRKLAAKIHKICFPGVREQEKWTDKLLARTYAKKDTLNWHGRFARRLSRLLSIRIFLSLDGRRMR